MSSEASGRADVLVWTARDVALICRLFGRPDLAERKPSRIAAFLFRYNSVSTTSNW